MSGFNGVDDSLVFPGRMGDAPASAVSNATDSQAVNMTLTEIDIYRQTLSDQMALTLLPAILVLTAVILIGVIGNSLVFYIYFLKFNPSSTRSAILALAGLDLLTSVVCIPGEILDLRFSYNFTSEVACKCLRMLNTAVLMASGLTLVTVALDRYQRICHPMHQQLTSKKATYRVLAVCMIAVFLSIPASFVYGLAHVPTNIRGVFGIECSTSEKFAKHPLLIAYNVELFCVFLGAFTTMIIIYVFIGRQVWRQSKFRKTVQQRTGSGGSVDPNRRNTVCVSEVEEAEHSSSEGHKESSVSHDPIPDNEPLSSSSGEANINRPRQHMNGNGTATKVARKSSVIHHLKKISRSANSRTRKTTMMLFLLTLVFVISFLPHLLIKVIQAVKKDFVDSLTTTDVVFYNIFVRSYFFNTAANAFVYGFCSPKFRHECRAICLRLTFWTKKRKASLQHSDLM